MCATSVYLVQHPTLFLSSICSITSRRTGVHLDIQHLVHCSVLCRVLLLPPPARDSLNALPALPWPAAQALGAPLGAALLTGLPARLVEFVMACVLLLVMCLHCNVVHHVKHWLLNRVQSTRAVTSCTR